MLLWACSGVRAWGLSRLRCEPRLTMPKKGSMPSVMHATGDDSKPLQSTTQSKRNKRKNKYEKFSKIEEGMDPLDRLMAESDQKNQAIKTGAENKKRRETAESQSSAAKIPPLPTIEFPDTKLIDPYDPTTFGYIEIGSIVGAHGVRGWVKVKASTDFIVERLCTAGIRHVKAPTKRAPRQITLLQGKHRHQDEYLVQFRDIMDRDAALRLRGSLLYVREEQRQQEDSQRLQEEEYLVSDLVGLEVFLVDEEPGQDGGKDEDHNRSFVGTVAGVVFADDLASIALGHDYLELVMPRGSVSGLASFRDELVLIPLVPQIVPIVDLSQRVIYIDPPEGLLDLTYVRDDKSRIKGFLPAPHPPQEE